MNKLHVVAFQEDKSRLDRMIQAAVSGLPHESVHTSHVDNWKSKRLLIAVDVDIIGGNAPLYKWLRSLYTQGDQPLHGAVAAILVNSTSALYTKRVAQYTLYHLNRLGCRVIGHPLVEATGQLENFLTWQKTMDLSLEDICMKMCGELGQRLQAYSVPSVDQPKILMLHASARETSNTLMLWQLISKHLPGAEIEEYHIQDDQIAECKGCTFRTCMHFSDMRSCYYGGIMVDQILPAIEAADAVVWICPNYNDAISAKLMAVINRLTVLYRRVSFKEKRLFSIIVSGNSGSDLLSTQLLGALNINKGFMLPPDYAMMAIANDPGSILEQADIQERAAAFGQQMMAEFHTNLE